MITVDLCTGVSPETLRARGGNKWNKYDADVLAAWIADMDFTVAEPVREAVAWAAAHSAFGYGRPEDQEALFRAASRWYAARHGWEPDPTAFLALSDVLQGIYAAIFTLTEPGDGVIVQGPIYPPFLQSIESLGRRVLDNRLHAPSDVAALDLDGLRQMAADPRAKLLLLCNPHNPTGRVFRREELAAIAEIVLEYDLVVVADEIWMDVLYPGHRHVPFASLGPEVAARTLTLTSATKSFNLGGLRCAVAIVGSPELRARFETLPQRVRGMPNVLGIRATIAAWTEGGPWLDTVLRQLDANRQALAAFLRERLPRVRHRSPEGTYMAWLDFSAYGLERPAALLLERARVALSDGADFGDAACARLNFATTPAILNAICERIAAALP